MPFTREQTSCECVYLVTFVFPVFCCCDLDLDLMTLVYELDLDNLKVHMHSKIKFPGQSFQKLNRTDGQIDRHTDRRDRTYYHSHIWGW